MSRSTKTPEPKIVNRRERAANKAQKPVQTQPAFSVKAEKRKARQSAWAKVRYSYYEVVTAVLATALGFALIYTVLFTAYITALVR